ncbi:MAG: 23S rRNA (uracil(1939)-C(5))-methyltransferase RlmD [Lachnospiraceae bacterium]|nr:23S rRNA (uracil(1939)-C(5))-methyltransferase RlmD [Lachnospiraceae bacterium]
MYEKNDSIILDIVDMTYDGLGIAKIDQVVFFVKGGVVGDKVEAIVTKNNKDRLIYAKAISIIESSPYRVEPVCKDASRCGGCMLMSLSYEKQIELKVHNVKNCLKRIGKIDEKVVDDVFLGIESFDMSPARYRNKIQVPFSIKDGKVIYGFYAFNTHYIVENDKCIVGFDGADKILKDIRDFLQDNNISIYDEKTYDGYFREAILRCGDNSGEISVTLVVGKTKNKNDKHSMDRLSEVLSKKYSDIKTITLNVNTKNNNVILGDKNFLLYGKGYIEDELLGVKYHISPESFYQVNNKMTEKLYDTVIGFGDFDKEEKVLDMYCGIGTISLIVANNVKKVLGIEVVDRAVQNAKENASINDIKNAEFMTLDASKLKKSKDSDDYIDILDDIYDTIIVDPPRKGLDNATVEYIKKVAPKKVVYVSCDPSTLSRDLDILTHDGDIRYTIKKIKCVDMFPYTMHVETVVLLNII